MSVQRHFWLTSLPFEMSVLTTLLAADTSPTPTMGKKIKPQSEFPVYEKHSWVWGIEANTIMHKLSYRPSPQGLFNKIIINNNNKFLCTISQWSNGALQKKIMLYLYKILNLYKSKLKLIITINIYM